MSQSSCSFFCSRVRGKWNNCWIQSGRTFVAFGGFMDKLLSSPLPDSGRKVKLVFSFILFVLLLIAVILYAGLRSYYAFHHQPATLTVFEDRETIKYPAATICPISRNPITPELCKLEYQQSTRANCMWAVKAHYVYFDGVNRTCSTFNYDGSLVSKSPDDEFIVRVQVNSSAVNHTESYRLGALVFVHPFDKDPLLTPASSFIVDVSKLTNVWLRLNKMKYFNGSTETSFVAYKVSPATLVSDEADSIIELNFIIPESGEFVTTEYYPYSANNWIGEVGGFACLMLFIYYALTMLVHMILMRKSRKTVAAKPADGETLGDPTV